MKRILITGANSYIGTSVEKYLTQWPDQYHVDTIDMIDASWREKSFVGYDSVFHVAGIAHVSTKKLNQTAREKYWAVNALLPVEVAKKAKADGVKQFIFLSSMSVYGEYGNIKIPVVITTETSPNPKDIYGKSKFEAEKQLMKLAHNEYRVVILRPPMVYGPGCKGNYRLLMMVALKFPIFPKMMNKRSVLSIDLLAEIIQTVIDEYYQGIVLPQDKEYMCTSDRVSEIARQFGRNMHLVKIFNPLICALSRLFPIINKVFGSLIYSMDSMVINNVEHSAINR